MALPTIAIHSFGRYNVIKIREGKQTKINTEVAIMTYEILKATKGYVLVINREDGTRNDYRFKNKAELNRWMKRAGMIK